MTTGGAEHEMFTDERSAHRTLDRMGPRFSAVAIVLATVAVMIAGRTAWAMASQPRADGVQVALRAQHPGRLPAPRSGTALVARALCECVTRARVDQISLATGRDLGTVAIVRGPFVATPVALGAQALITSGTGGPACRGSLPRPLPPRSPEAAPAAGCVPTPRTCSNQVRAVDLRTGHSWSPARIGRSRSVYGVVPSPDGQRLAIVDGRCGSAGSGLEIRGGADGRRLTIGPANTLCDGLIRPSWSDDGRQITFLSGDFGGGFISPCPFSRPAIEIASSARSSRRSDWTTVPVPRGLAPISVGFDSTGIVALTVRGPTDQGGPAVLVQLDAHHRVVTRIALHRFVDDGSVATEPGTGDVIVSAFEPGGVHSFDHDELWIFDAHRLRLVRRYLDRRSSGYLVEPW